MSKNNNGFTLVEVVVVLAVVAILAAILTPNIVKNIQDSKLARAANETQVIAASIASFYKDLGRWPTANGANANLPDTIRLLYGQGSAPTNAGAQSQFWRSDAGWGAGFKDTFTNHLIENDPGDGANDYISTGELKWSGPYIIEVKPDPWGSHYSCNIRYGFFQTFNAVGVLSAGPDRVFNTDAIQTSSAFQIGNDDVITRLQ